MKNIWTSLLDKIHNLPGVLYRGRDVCLAFVHSYTSKLSFLRCYALRHLHVLALHMDFRVMIKFHIVDDSTKFHRMCFSIFLAKCLNVALGHIFVEPKCIAESFAHGNFCCKNVVAFLCSFRWLALDHIHSIRYSNDHRGQQFSQNYPGKLSADGVNKYSLQFFIYIFVRSTLANLHSLGHSVRNLDYRGFL